MTLDFLIAIAVGVLTVPSPALVHSQARILEAGVDLVAATDVQTPARYVRFILTNRTDGPVYFKGRSLTEPLYGVYRPDPRYPEPTPGWRPLGPGWCGNGVIAVELPSGDSTYFDVPIDMLRERPMRVGLTLYWEGVPDVAVVVFADVPERPLPSTPSN
jgi:hypothetical protein